VSPERSRAILSASSRLIPRARSNTRLNSPGSLFRAAPSSRRSSSPATGKGARGRVRGYDLQIDRYESSLFWRSRKEQIDQIILANLAACCDTRGDWGVQHTNDDIGSGWVGCPGGG